MNRNEFLDRINYCRRELEWLLAQPMDCTTCSRFDKKDTCRLYGPVPANYITRGCDEWDFDEVPF